MGSFWDIFKDSKVLLAAVIIVAIFLVQPPRDLFNSSIRGVTNLLFFDNSIFSVIFLLIVLYIVWFYFFKGSGKK